MKFLLDSGNGITRWMEYDYATDTTTEYAEQDFTPEIEATKSLQNDPEYWKDGVKNEFAHYGHIPVILLEKWSNEGVDINDMQALFQMINKPEYSYLKTTTKNHRA